jgi:hypothetical protein
MNAQPAIRARATDINVGRDAHEGFPNEAINPKEQPLIRKSGKIMGGCTLGFNLQYSID